MEICLKDIYFLKDTDDFSIQIVRTLFSNMKEIKYKLYLRHKSIK